MRSPGFGVPVPLVNQPKTVIPARESEKLEQDASLMAERLEQLKIQLIRENERRETSVKVGGATWKSARADKTSAIRGYAKEVQRQQLVRKAVAGSMGTNTVPNTSIAHSSTISSSGRGGASNQMPSSPSSSPSGSRNKSSRTTARGAGDADPMSWTVNDVLSWLARAPALHKYIDRFAKNEISGPVLLEIGLDDLDYMDITVLGHRKLILKGIEDLRRRSSARDPHPSPRTHIARSPSRTYTAEPPAKTNRPIERVLIARRWDALADVNTADHSHTLTPCPQGPTSSSPSPPSYGRSPTHGHGSMVTPLSQGHYDEKQASAAFNEAVQEWRRMAGTGVKIVKDDGRGGAPEVVVVQDDGMWRNPFAPSHSRADVHTTAAADHKPSNCNPNRGGGGGKLLEGELDEEGEHKAFVAAVEEWRRGRSGTDGGGSGRESEDIARDLASKLDEDREARRREMEQKKREYMEKMNDAQDTIAKAQDRVAKLTPRLSANNSDDTQSSSLASPTLSLFSRLYGMGEDDGGVQRGSMQGGSSGGGDTVDASSRSDADSDRRHGSGSEAEGGEEGGEIGCATYHAPQSRVSVVMLDTVMRGASCERTRASVAEAMAPCEQEAVAVVEVPSDED